MRASPYLHHAQLPSFASPPSPPPLTMLSSLPLLPHPLLHPSPCSAPFPCFPTHSSTPHHAQPPFLPSPCTLLHSSAGCMRDPLPPHLTQPPTLTSHS
ncbi:hypothetical protein Pmani_037651 [Petrolisthes manimaculis]|uniref:Uncharacterized protein n=1 Tax=Petrolisthes manimaculis TaxID=1843537 RepID=A0AAE1NFY6_9EUCA|nr:hypothetical protein Pmani_037651 [Petrolisthes manimaculis]